MDHHLVESVAAAVVREYLHGKGCEKTLQCIDSEMIRSDDSITSRSKLAKLLHIEKLLKKNKQNENTLKTTLEVLVKYFLNHSTTKKASASKNTTKCEQSVGLNPLTKDFSDEFRNAMKLAQSANIAKLSGKTKKPLCKNPPGSSNDTKSLSNETTIALHTETQMDEENISVLSGDQQIGFASDLKPSMQSQDELSTATANQLGHGTNQDDELNNTETNKPQRSIKSSVSQRRLFSGPITRGGLQSGRGSLTSAARRNFLSSTANHPVKLNLISHHDGEASVRSTDNEASLGGNEVQEKIETTVPEEVKSFDWYEDTVNETEMGNRVTSELEAHSPSNKLNLKIALVGICGDLEVGDLDELDESNSGVLVSPEHSYAWITMPHSTPIQYETAVELKTLLFGSYKMDFPFEWKMQSFCLSTNSNVIYGIVQKKGGPCGVLACVQAYLIKELIFGKSAKAPIKGKTFEEDCKKSLVNALAKILWKIGRSQKAVVVMPTNRINVDLPGLHDGFIERINLMQFTDYAALQSFISRHATWFTDDNKYSCISFLYSAILSRGIDTVKNDMDDHKSCLIGTHGYCSQEVVNLLLTGCASTNVFDNVITLDGGMNCRSVLKGVTCQSEIGLLALYEHYNSCQVGAFLKCPRYPIWVVCSESHFSVLFAKDAAVCEASLEDENKINNFDLYYYDGILHQEEEIKLTISLSDTFPITYPKDLEPPLDLCIRTKWKDAHVEWNGIEPLL